MEAIELYAHDHANAVTIARVFIEAWRWINRHMSRQDAEAASDIIRGDVDMAIDQVLAS